MEGDKTTVYAFSQLFLNSNTGVEWYLSDYEHDIYYKQYNIQLVEHYEYNVYFITSPGSVCVFSSDFTFTTYIPENVFAISKIKININTIDARGNIGAH